MIEEITDTFSAKEKNEFRYFLLRQKYSKGRKDLQLYDMICNRPGGKAGRRSEITADAYHGQRKRLLKYLSDFILVKEKQEDITNAGNISGWINLSKYFFRHGLTNAAWKFLVKAEKAGWEAEQYELLGSVYLLMIEHFQAGGTIELEEIIRMQKKAKLYAEENERIIISTALIKKRLDESKSNLGLTDFPSYVEATLEKYNLGQVLLNRPAHLIHLLEIVRNSYLAMRQLKNFEPFILEHYSRFSRSVARSKHHHEYALRFLYMIAHVMFRNRKFSQAKKYLDQLSVKMEDHNRIYYRQFYTKYISLLSSIKSFSGENDSAIMLHEKCLGDKKMKLSIREELNFRLNLVFFYFNASQFRKASAVFLKMNHSDQFYIKQMGKEWVMRKKLIQLILHYELGHEDISLRIINQIGKEFSDLFALPQYVKAKNFVHLIRNYINDPYSLNFKEFRSIAGKELFLSDPDEEESKAIAFYSWLKSKITGKEYYSTLLEEIKLTRQVV